MEIFLSNRFVLNNYVGKAISTKGAQVEPKVEIQKETISIYNTSI